MRTTELPPVYEQRYTPSLPNKTRAQRRVEKSEIRKAVKGYLRDLRRGR